MGLRIGQGSGPCLLSQSQRSQLLFTVSDLLTERPPVDEPECGAKLLQPGRALSVAARLAGLDLEGADPGLELPEQIDVPRAADEEWAESEGATKFSSYPDAHVVDGRHFFRDGRPCTFATWCMLIEFRPDYRRIERTEVGEFDVSTVWLGLDHNFGFEGERQTFETMVFRLGSRSNLRCERYSTEAEAREGHERIVREVREGKTRAED